MKVFLSWSGERSRAVAEALRSWLPRVLQSLRPWMSQEDIAAGSRWLFEVSGELADSGFGIICVTQENQKNEWLLFEAGALSKTLASSFVCPLLLDISPGQLSGPLVQFQATSLNREGVEKLLMSLNKALGQNQLPESDLREIFEVWWPKLETSLSEVPAVAEKLGKKRSIEEMLEEAVSNSREQLRREQVRLEWLDDRDRIFQQMQSILEAQVRRVAELPSIFMKSLEDSDPTLMVDTASKVVDMLDLTKIKDEMWRTIQAQTDAILGRATVDGGHSPQPQLNNDELCSPGE